MSANIKDVAKLSGFSISTVSRVLSGAANVKAESKEKVMAAVKELNYHPNEIARSLVGGSTKTIGLILSASEDTVSVNGFFTKATIGISHYAQECSYNVMIAFADDQKKEMTCIKNYISSKNVDGIILFANRENDECIAYLYNSGIPFAVIGKPDSYFNCLWVDNDNMGASVKAVRYLFEKGHHRIGFIKGPEGYHVSNDRYLGYLEALKDNGMEIDESIIYHNADFTIEAGFGAAEKMLSHLTPEKYPTAIMSSDDLQAIGVLRFLKKQHLENISVMGFNNISLTEFTTPNITSVDVNPQKLGEYAMKMIVDYIESNNETLVNYIVETSIIDRDSVYELSGDNDDR